MKEKTDLEWLEGLRERAKVLRKEQDDVVASIRAGFVKRAIVFMDVVGSTAFKVEHDDSPEVWILRVRQFSELMASAAESCGGKVVKFIGDEIMVTFKSVYDAQNLVGRIAEIEKNLMSATGHETRIKVAADYGSVYELSFEGHETPDPQGTPVDRCARIAKYGMPGEVLASEAFVKETDTLKWVKIGRVELKGIGRENVYQLGKATVKLVPRVELPKDEYEALTKERDMAQARAARLEEQNKALQEQLEEAGEEPDPENVADADEEDEAWKPVQRAIDALKSVITDVRGPSSTYARFLFLYHSGSGAMEYNKFEGNTFDELIDLKLVGTVGDSEDSSYYELQPDHPRNKKALGALRKAEDVLSHYLRDHKPKKEDLFEWSFSDPEFWEAYVDISVL